MKDLIRQILRKETSGLTDGQIKYSYDFMNILTKGYQWYHDTPEQPFERSEGSIWLINPETKEWMLELQNDGDLWYKFKTPDTFSRYLNMERSDFESFIKVWVEDALKREVISMHRTGWSAQSQVEDVLKNGKQMK